MHHLLLSISICRWKQCSKTEWFWCRKGYQIKKETNLYQHYVFSPTTTQTIVKPHNGLRYWKEKRTIFKKELFPRCNRGGLNVKVLQIHSNSDISLRKYFLLSYNPPKSQKKFCFSFHSHFLLISTMPLVSFYSTILYTPTNNTRTILCGHQIPRNILNTPYFGIFIQAP